MVDGMRLLEDEVKREFRQEKTMRLKMLMEGLQCSRSTAQRRLKQWCCHTSYNHNGAFYALPEVVEFNEYGLWQYRGVCFSIHGNLSQTVTALVNNAPAGMTVTELSSVLGVNANSFIGAFVQDGKKRISRERLGSRFVYTSSDERVKEKQIQCRSEADQHCLALSYEDAVTVLVALIKAPTLDPAGLAKVVRSRAPTASAETIGKFFSEHGLAAAKKGALHPL